MKSNPFYKTLKRFNSFIAACARSNLVKVAVVLKIIGSIVFGLLLLSCSPEDDGIYFDQALVDDYDQKVIHSALKSDILHLVNSHRKELNLNELNSLDIISSVALDHTNYMISEGIASHDNFAERSQYLIENANAKTVGENVAYGYSSAQGVFNAWMNSSGHKKVIENPNYTHFGISSALDDKKRYYFTHIFISKKTI